MRKGRAINISIEKDPIEEELKPRPRYYLNGTWHYYTRSSSARCDLLRLNDDAATVIETAFIDRTSVVPRWPGYIDGEHRKRRFPLLLSLSFYTAVARPFWRYRGPPRFKNSIRAVSLCSGGSHCLVFDVGDVNSKWDREDMLKNKPLHRLLEDQRIAVVGIGMRKFAAQAREEWGVDVANPVELRSVMGEAIGEGKIRSGKLDVEEMGEVVLDGMRVRKKPRRIKKMDWGRDEITEEALMYAARDAYLAFEIGKKCFEMIVRKI